MGHASTAFTLDVYGHLYSDEMDIWAARLDGHMWAERGQTGESAGGGLDLTSAE